MKIEAPNFETIALSLEFPNAWQPLLCVGEFDENVYVGSTRVRTRIRHENTHVDLTPHPPTDATTPTLPYAVGNELAKANLGWLKTTYPIKVTASHAVLYSALVAPEIVSLYSDYALYVVTPDGDLAPDTSLPSSVWTVSTIQVQPDKIYIGCGVFANGYYNAAVYSKGSGETSWTLVSIAPYMGLRDYLPEVLRYPVTGIQVFASRVIYGTAWGLYEVTGTTTLRPAGSLFSPVWQVAKWRSNILFYAVDQLSWNGFNYTYQTGWFSLYPLTFLGGTCASLVPENAGAALSGEWYALSRESGVHNSLGTLQSGLEDALQERLRLPDGSAWHAAWVAQAAFAKLSVTPDLAGNEDAYARSHAYDGIFRWEGMLFCFGQDFREFPTRPWWGDSATTRIQTPWSNAYASTEYEGHGVLAAFAPPYFADRIVELEQTIQMVYPQEDIGRVYAIAHPNAKLRLGPFLSVSADAGHAALGGFFDTYDGEVTGVATSPDTPARYPAMQGSAAFDWVGYGVEKLEAALDYRLMFGGSLADPGTGHLPLLTAPTATVDTVRWQVLRASQGLRAYWAGVDWAATEENDQPTVSEASFSHADGSGSATPTVSEVELEFSDGSGTGSPVVTEVALDTESRPFEDPTVYDASLTYSDGSGEVSPIVNRVEYTWAWEEAPTIPGEIVLKVISNDAARNANAITVIPNLPIASWATLRALYRVTDTYESWADAPGWDEFTCIPIGETIQLPQPGLCVKVAVIAPDTTPLTTTVNLAIPREDA